MGRVGGGTGRPGPLLCPVEMPGDWGVATGAGRGGGRGRTTGTDGPGREAAGAEGPVGEVAAGLLTTVGLKPKGGWMGVPRPRSGGRSGRLRGLLDSSSPPAGATAGEASVCDCGAGLCAFGAATGAGGGVATGSGTCCMMVPMAGRLGAATRIGGATALFEASAGFGASEVSASTGFASTGFASTGFASTGFASTGFASTGFPSTGFASETGLASTAGFACPAGFASIGLAAATGGAGS